MSDILMPNMLTSAVLIFLEPGNDTQYPHHCQTNKESLSKWK